MVPSIYQSLAEASTSCCCVGSTWFKAIMKINLFILIFGLLLPSIRSNDQFLCESPQYVELGSRTSLTCIFPEDFFGIFWYDTSDFLSQDPIVYVKNIHDKGGQGYETNEYDMAPDGSLIINEVAWKHDRNFTAVLLMSTDDDFSPNGIHAVVTVKPLPGHPIIDVCSFNRRICFKKMNESFQMDCYVNETRPAVNLNWFLRTTANDTILPSKSITTTTNQLCDSHSILNVTYSIRNAITVYVCKGSSSASLLVERESIILVQSDMLELKENRKFTKYVQQHEGLNLNCTNKLVLYIVWRKKSLDRHMQSLVDVLFMNNTATNIYSPEYKIDNAGNLLLSEAHRDREGFYICIFGDGITETINTFDVREYVLPDPTYPLVAGCSNHHNCELTVTNNGTLTCFLVGIHPAVKLRWRVVHQAHSSLITIFNDKYTIKRKGLTAIISLTIDFFIQDSFNGTLSMLCETYDLNGLPLLLSTNVDLQIVKDDTIENVLDTTTILNTENKTKHLRMIFFIVWSVIVIIVLLLIIGAVLLVMKMTRPAKQDLATVEESTPLHDVDLQDELKNICIKLLSKTYTKACDEIKASPQTSHSIDYIFSEGNIEYMDSSKAQDANASDKWTKLNSYKDILDTEHTKYIIEGDHGYGKSTLGLKFAKDWCISGKLGSHQTEIEIFILLQMRHLEGCISIPEAIRHILLGGHPKVTTAEVKNLLEDCTSLVIYLDGFNECCDRESVLEKCLTFKPLKLIITTISSCLPKGDHGDTKRIRLIDFDSRTSQKYIEKVSPHKNAIKNNFSGDLVLGDLCRVPLFLGLLANADVNPFHETYCKSITDFAEKIFACFSAQVISNKEHVYSILGAISVEALCSSKRSLLFDKQVILKKLGQKSYNECIKIGFLVEVPCACGGNPKVGFYHNILSEWFAASELSKRLPKISKKEAEQIFKKIDALEYEYIYRFVCGKDIFAAGRVIEYFESKTGRENIMILCFFEQVGNFKSTHTKTFPAVTISAKDTSFVQRAAVEILKVASQEGVCIPLVIVENLLSVFHSSEAEVNCQLLLPLPVKIETLSVRTCSSLEGHIEDILQFAAICDSLKVLRLETDTQPDLQEQKVQIYQNMLKEKKVTVEWSHTSLNDVRCTMDWKTGKWKEGSSEPLLCNADVNSEPTSAHGKQLQRGFTEQSENEYEEIEQSKNEYEEIEQSANQ